MLPGESGEDAGIMMNGKCPPFCFKAALLAGVLLCAPIVQAAELDAATEMLFKAVAAGNLADAEAAIAAGADLAATNDQGQTPGDLALATKKLKLVKLLLEAAKTQQTEIAKAASTPETLQRETPAQAMEGEEIVQLPWSDNWDDTQAERPGLETAQPIAEPMSPSAATTPAQSEDIVTQVPWTDDWDASKSETPTEPAPTAETAETIAQVPWTDDWDKPQAEAAPEQAGQQPAASDPTLDRYEMADPLGKQIWESDRGGPPPQAVGDPAAPSSPGEAIGEAIVETPVISETMTLPGEEVITVSEGNAGFGGEIIVDVDVDRPSEQSADTVENIVYAPGEHPLDRLDSLVAQVLGEDENLPPPEAVPPAPSIIAGIGAVYAPSAVQHSLKRIALSSRLDGPVPQQVTYAGIGAVPTTAKTEFEGVQTPIPEPKRRAPVAYAGVGSLRGNSGIPLASVAPTGTGRAQADSNAPGVVTRVLGGFSTFVESDFFDPDRRFRKRDETPQRTGDTARQGPLDFGDQAEDVGKPVAAGPGELEVVLQRTEEIAVAPMRPQLASTAPLGTAGFPSSALPTSAAATLPFASGSPVTTPREPLPNLLADTPGLFGAPPSKPKESQLAAADPFGLGTAPGPDDVAEVPGATGLFGNAPASPPGPNEVPEVSGATGLFGSSPPGPDEVPEVPGTTGLFGDALPSALGPNDVPEVTGTTGLFGDSPAAVAESEPVQQAMAPPPLGPKPELLPPSALPLEGKELRLNKKMQLGMKVQQRKNLGVYAKTCVEKNGENLVFCLQPGNWPAKIERRLYVNSIVYQGTKTIVRYDDGLATRLHALFASDQIDYVVGYFQDLYGAPTTLIEEKIAPFASPRRINRVFIWRSSLPKEGKTQVLTVREFDNTRGGFPDMKNGAIMLEYANGPEMFPAVSPLEVMLLKN